MCHITNAANYFIGNAASGGWNGFQFPNLPRAIGAFKNEDYGDHNPWHRPLYEFDGNTAHSSGFYWKNRGPCIYVGGTLIYKDDSTPRLLLYKSATPYEEEKRYTFYAPPPLSFLFNAPFHISQGDN